MLLRTYEDVKYDMKTDTASESAEVATVVHGFRLDLYRHFSTDSKFFSLSQRIVFYSLY